ncbi:MAG: SnoaL-like domain [Pseudomonadota bacterium]|jgi:ketosteroid isomerase-like protein
MADAHRELEDYVHDWYANFPRGDAEAMGALYTNDARLFLANLPGATGREVVGKMLGSFPRYVDLACRYEVNDIDVLSHDIAIVTGRAWADATPKGGGETTTDASRFVMVMKRDPDTKKWLCHYDISQHSPDVPAQPPSSP